MTHKILCAGRTRADLPCRAYAAGVDGYCPAHDPHDGWSALFIAAPSTDQRDPCPRCGTHDNDHPVGAAVYLWHHDDLDTAPLCRPCLDQIDPIHGHMLDTWAHITADLDPELTRLLHIWKSGDLDTHYAADLLASGDLTLPTDTPRHATTPTPPSAPPSTT